MSRGIRVGISEKLLGEVILKNKELQEENEQLKEVLRKCQPYGGENIEAKAPCIFCKAKGTL